MKNRRRNYVLHIRFFTLPCNDKILSNQDVYHKTADIVIRPIANDGMYVMSVFLIRKDRELSNVSQMFLREIGIEV